MLLGGDAGWTGGKQRLTATQLHRLVVAEGHRVCVTLVKAYVAQWRRQRQEVFVPLVYRPGDLAEVDFFEVLVDVGGVRRKAWMSRSKQVTAGTEGVTTSWSELGTGASQRTCIGCGTTTS